MTTMTTLFTRAQYNLLPEGFPAQLVEGMLVREPAPTYGHQYIASRLHAQLVKLVGPDRALTGPVDVVIDEVNVYQPDLVVLARPTDPAQSSVGIPLIAIEVLSPSSRKRDREVKRHRLLAAGVREVWLVDPQVRAIERWNVDGMREATGRSSLSSDAVEGFSLTPDELLSPPR